MHPPLILQILVHATGVKRLSQSILLHSSAPHGAHFSFNPGHGFGGPLFDCEHEISCRDFLIYRKVKL